VETAPQSLAAERETPPRRDRMPAVSRAAQIGLATVAVAAMLALASGIDRTDFMPPDEARVSEISREMSQAPSWAIPMLNGKPFLEEPPLFYWMQAAIFRVAGEATTALARVPAVAGAILGTVATGFLAQWLGTGVALAAVVVATAPEYWWMARNATPDSTAAAATTLALALFFVAWRSGSRASAAAAVAALGLAFWAKSFLPVGLAVVTAVVFLVTSGRGRLSWRALAAMAAGIGAATGLWVVLIAGALGRDAVEFFVVTNHLVRLAGGRGEGHMRPLLYYLPNVLLGFLPWSLALPAATLAAWRHRAAPERRFPLVWAASMTLVLSVAATKRPHYLLPAYPAFAVLIAQWLPEAWSGRFDRVSRRLLVATAAVVPTLAAPALLGMDVSQLVGVPDEARIAAVWQAVVGAFSVPSAWLGAAAFGALGIALLATDRRGRWMPTTVMIAVPTIALHLLLTLVVLPRFDTETSARAWGARLGRIQARGAPLVTFGFPRSEALAPFMFYARRQFRALDGRKKLIARIDAAPACIFIQAKDYARFERSIPGRVVERGRVGGLDLLLVESSPGICDAG
jgi:4-amino-4-deoxy-L-arabinose transferase-like glycosyltransferase